MIALDAMGGDLAPCATVQGAINAAKKGICIGLFGDKDQLTTTLHSIDRDWRSLPISLFHCSQTISMGEEPSRGVIKKQNSSLVQAIQVVADGRAQAVVSAGNSGAALVAGTLILGRIDGIMRPAIGGFLPTRTGSIFCLDFGANTDCKPTYLEQFALMGHVYVRMMQRIRRPRIALLSNGVEEYKGSLVIKQAYASLKKNKHIHFIGNLEARDIFDDYADVLVCDGFSGNVLLKSIQGTVRMFSYLIKQEGSRSLCRKIWLSLSAGIFKGLKRKTDYAQKGGALLLGLKHPLIIAHGCSHAVAIENALLFAARVVRDNIIPTFSNELSGLIRKKSNVSRVITQKVRSLFKHVEG